MGTRLIPKVKGHEKHIEQKSSCTRWENTLSQYVQVCECGRMTEVVRRNIDQHLFTLKESLNLWKVTKKNKGMKHFPECNTIRASPSPLTPKQITILLILTQSSSSSSGEKACAMAKLYVKPQTSYKKAYVVLNTKMFLSFLIQYQESYITSGAHYTTIQY